ncbi:MULTISPECIES: sensor histidine kinase [unclassified Lentimonas]|uniref:sensor histidine kinase n=2 Tax=Lentimonas TaxID=417293 RepID=UPI001389F92F|nr:MULTISPECIES: histidine kinase [unclassified Lentimonas]
MHMVLLNRFRMIRSIACGLLFCMLTLNLSAIEGIDYRTEGDWNTPTTLKPWSYDGQNRYGTAGYHFYNVTPLGGKKQANRPVDENLKSALPSYIKSITAAEKTYTTNSFGYLKIDAPGGSKGDKAESGLLAKMPHEPGAHVELLTIQLGKIENIYGFRVGILLANADRKEISPAEIVLSSERDTNWSRSIINLPKIKDGMWVFFNVSAKHSNDTLTLSVKCRDKHPAAIGGLVFDDLIVEPPEHPLNVISDKAVSHDGSAIWNAILGAPVEATIDDTWEHYLAMKLSGDYRKNEARIQAINDELGKLPTPYTGEPTGTGGYLCHWTGSNRNRVEINFRWSEPVSIDAIALLPLRLFLADENGLTDNAYWPGEIQIHAINGEQSTRLTTILEKNQRIRESLPELVTFQPHTTQHLRITLSDLAKKIGGYQFAGGFSEIYIFSQEDNVAPLAKIAASNSREGFRVFSKGYLTDEQTPLGLPEIGPRISGSLGLSVRPDNRHPKKPVDIVLNFKEPVTIDAVRLDPAVIYRPGQAFPIRFSVDLLNASGEVLQSDRSYRNTPLRNQGLNPYISHFPDTTAKSIRVRIFEISKPTDKSRPWVQISEITPMLKGAHIDQLATVSVLGMSQRSKSTGNLFGPTGRRLYWQDAFVYDGQTQAGRALPLREWVQGLYDRKQLLEEKLDLAGIQQDTTHSIRTKTLWSVCLLSAFVVLTSLYQIIQSKVKNRRDLRMARERIASDLHDDVGSNLGSITLHTEMLMDQVEAPSLVEHLQAIAQLSHESVYGLREVLHTSAPRIGRAQDILKYMEELSRLVFPDMHVALDLDPAVNKTLKTPERRKGLLLYYKEAITNIRSHAQCNRVSVSLHRVKNHLELIIEDDGVGMTAQKLSQQSTLRTLKLRAKEMNAALKIKSKVDQGTRLELHIPLININ